MSLLTAIRPKAAAPVSEDVKEYVLKRAADFTMIPAAAMKAMEIGRNPACSVKEYSGAIERDVRLTTDILSMANSSMFTNGAPASSLNDAVRRLGLRRCQGLILSTCTAGLMKTLPFKQAQVREVLWRHGYMTAVICRHLNESLRLGFTGEEFTAGLMHDLGRSLLAAIVPERYAELAAEAGGEGPQMLELEQALLGTDHCELGAAFGARNGLPAPLLSVIQYHHAPQLAGEYQKLVAAVAMADQMANRLEACSGEQVQECQSTGFSRFLGDGDTVRKALAGVTPELAEQALTEAKNLIS